MRRSRDLSPPSPPSDSHIGRRPKACFACRKVKHKCIPSDVVPGQCTRCVSREEPCNYGVPVQEDAWKQWATHEIQRLHDMVFSLERRTRRSASPGPSGEPSNRDAMTTTREMREMRGDEVFSFGRNSPSAAALDGRSHRPTPPEPYRMTHPSEIYGLNPLPLLGSASSAQMSNDRSQPLQATGEASGSREMGRMGTLGERMLIASAKNAGPLLPDIGSLDPRPSVISKRVLTPSEARSMVTYFFRSLSPSMYGFALTPDTYPLLPGLATLTPLLFNVMTLLAAQRMPTLHRLIGPLLDEWRSTNPIEGVEEEHEPDPTIDIELGIGPEEITAVALLSMFSSVGGAEGGAGLNWARGLGKLDASREPTTSIGELIGFHTPRRQPSRLQSLRLILFAYICSVHETVLAEQHGPKFNPLPLVDEFNALRRRSDFGTEPGDVLLVMHARLARAMAQWQLWCDPNRTKDWRGHEHWRSLSPKAPHPGLEEEPCFHDGIHAVYPKPCPDDTMKLWTPLYLYARLRVYLDGAERHVGNIGLADHERCSCHSIATDHACEIIVDLEAARAEYELATLPRIYIEAASLAGAVMIDELTKRLDCEYGVTDMWLSKKHRNSTLDRLENVAMALLTSALPGDHYAPVTGHRLLTGIQHLKQSSTFQY